MDTQTKLTIISIVAIILGPIVSVLISVYVGKRLADGRIKLDRKFMLLSTIVALQWKGITEDEAKALNLIDLVFHDVPDVREKWHNYYDSLHITGKPTETTFKQWQSKKLELVQAMASNIGYRQTISPIDLSRVYSPVGLQPPLDIQTIDNLIAFLLDKKKEIANMQLKQLQPDLDLPSSN